MLNSAIESQVPAIYLSQVIVRSRLPCIIPRRLVERCICFFQSLLVLQRKPEIVICVALGRVRISRR